MKLYEILKDIGAFSGLVWLVKWLWEKFSNRLTLREMQLLVAAESSAGWIQVWNQPVINTNDLQLGNDSVHPAEFIDALYKLQNRGYVRQTHTFPNSDQYHLTGVGMKVAQSLLKAIPLKDIPGEPKSAFVGAVI